MGMRGIFVAVIVLLTAFSAVPLAAAQSNPGVHRENQWLLRDSLSSGPATTSFTYGRVGDLGQMCDWDGDGDTSPAVLRPVNGRWVWHVRQSNSGGSAEVTFAFGLETDRAVCGDWDGDGDQTPGVVRERSDHRFEWHLRNELAGGGADETFVYGREFHPDEPIPSFPLAGDCDGDADDTPGVAVGREDGRFEWHLRNELAGGAADEQFVYYGGAVWGDHLEVHSPVVGDWDQDGDVTVGVVRGHGGTYRWLLRNQHAAGSADEDFFYGRHLDAPVVWEE